VYLLKVHSVSGVYVCLNYNSWLSLAAFRLVPRDTVQPIF